MHSKLIVFLLILITEINFTYGLSKYCSASSNIEFRKAFDNCTKLKSNTNNNNNNINGTVKQHEELLALLDKVSDALKEENSTKDETKRLLLDLVQIITIVNYDGTTKFCMRASVCNLFKNS